MSTMRSAVPGSVSDRAMTSILPSCTMIDYLPTDRSECNSAPRRYMPEATHDLVIERSIEEVFAFLADTSNHAAWRPSDDRRARRLLSTVYEVTEMTRNSSIRIRGTA